MKMKQLIPLIALLPFVYPTDACGQGGYGMRRAKTEAYIIIDTFYGNPTVAANYRKTLKAVENLYPTIMYFDQWEFDKLSPRTRSAPLRSSCKVTKGGKDIKKALEEGQEIMVVSDKGATTKNSQ